MRIYFVFIWLVIVSAALGQAPIQRNTWTTNSNPVFKGNSNVVYSNINSTVTYEFYGDPRLSSNRVTRMGDLSWTNYQTSGPDSTQWWIIRDKNPTNSVASFASVWNQNDLGDWSAIVRIGYIAGNEANYVDSYGLYSIGDYAGMGQVMTNAGYVFNYGYFTGESQSASNSFFIFNIGNSVGQAAVFLSAQNIFNWGNKSGFGTRLTSSQQIHNYGYYGGAYMDAQSSFNIFNYGYRSGGANATPAGLRVTNSENIFNYGYEAGAWKSLLLSSTNLYNYGSYAGTNMFAQGANRIYFYGAYSGADSRTTNASDVYGFGTYALRDAKVVESTNIFAAGIDPLEHAQLTNSHNITAIGFEAMENAKLTNSLNIIVLGNTAGTNLAGVYQNLVLIGQGAVPTASSNQIILGRQNVTNVIQGALQIGPNAGYLTNTLYGSATLNFASTSSGAIEDLAITVTGAADGDIVSVGVPVTAATGIIGSYSGFASNDTVFVRFTPTAATQNPNSGTFKVRVDKFQ